MAKRKAKAKPRRRVPYRMLVQWGKLRNGLKEEVFYYQHGLRSVPNVNSARRVSGKYYSAGQAHQIRRVSAVNYRSTGRNWPGFSRRDRFAVRWSGILFIRRPGNYHYLLRSDDGSRMYIDNRYMLNNDGLHGMRTRTSKYRMVKGQSKVRIEFFENGGGAGCQFKYHGADTGNRWRIVSGSAVRYALESGFKERVFYSWGGLKSVPNMNRIGWRDRVVRQVVYGNTNRAWSGFADNQNFAVRWTGYLRIYRTGTYRWSLGSDDGSRLYLNGRYIVNNDGLHGFRWRESNYRIGGRVHVRLEFFERGGHAGMLFRYMGPDTRNRMVWVRDRMTAAL